MSDERMNRLASIVLLLAACGTEAGETNTSEAPPSEEPSPSWIEPERPWTAPGPIDPFLLEKSAYLRVALPANANAANGRAYWLTGDEPIEFRIDFGFGAAHRDRREPVQAVLLIDGVLQRASFDGGAPATASVFELGREEQKSIDVRLETSDLTDGAHLLLVTVAWPGPVSPSTVDLSIAIYKNSTEYRVEHARPPTEPVPDPAIPFSVIWVGDSDRAAQGDVNVPANGVLPLRFDIAGYPGQEGNAEQLIIAMLDSEQGIFADYGPSPIVVTKGDELQRFDLQLPIVRDRHRPERLQFWYLMEPHALPEKPDGTLLEGELATLVAFPTANLVYPE